MLVQYNKNTYSNAITILIQLQFYSQTCISESPQSCRRQYISQPHDAESLPAPESLINDLVNYLGKIKN